MYEDWFQLVQRPFGTAPDGKVYFPSNGIEAARSAMTRCIERGGGPGLVIGETGVGKTTLAMKLIDQFRASVPVAYLSGRGIVSRRELLQTILFELGRPYAHDDGELRLALIDVLTSSDASRKRTLLVFDDADQLSEDLLAELSAVSNLARDGFWSTDVLLLGTVRLEESLALPSLVSLANRIAARYYLHPLGFEETEAYMRFQVQQIGGGTRGIFTNEAVAEILETTGGIPRTINQLCDHALVLAVSNGMKHVDAQAAQEAWADLQQLPPVDHSQHEEPTESFIEFGALDEGPAVETQPQAEFDAQRSGRGYAGDEPGPGPDRTADAGAELVEVGTQTQLFPEMSLDTIERQVAEIVEVHQGQREEGARRVSDAEPPSLTPNPFLESFDEEEVVLDLPLGIQGAAGPPLQPMRNVKAPSGEEDGLLNEVLRQMGELEHRSLMLGESLVSAQQDLAQANRDSLPVVLEETTICKSGVAGDPSGNAVSQNSELAQATGASALGTSGLAQPAIPTQVTEVSDHDPVDGDDPPHEPSLVQTIDAINEVQFSAVEDVLPCESIDCVCPRAMVSETDENINAPETLDGSPAAHESTAELSVPEESTKPPKRGSDSPGARHDAEAWPPQQKRQRFARLFVNLRNQ